MICKHCKNKMEEKESVNSLFSTAIKYECFCGAKCYVYLNYAKGRREKWEIEQ